MKKKPVHIRPGIAGVLQSVNPDPTFSAAIDDETGKWLDKQDVMHLMYISSRTLQKWRSNGTIKYARIGGKFYYPESSIRQLLLANLR